MGFKDICFAIHGKVKPHFKAEDIEAKPVGVQNQYFAEETLSFIDQMGEFAPNPYVVEVQEVGSIEWKKHYARMTDVIADPKTGQSRGDTWKNIIFYGNIPKVTLGIKLRFENNIWIGYNSANFPSITSSIVARQCGAVLNWLDQWGNVITEPCVLDSYETMDADNMTNPSIPVTLKKGDKKVFVQNNINTMSINDNARFIIGGQAWRVFGVDRTQRQETLNKDSVYTMQFNISKDEPVATDDMENEIANGKSIVWEIKTDTSLIKGVIGNFGTINATVYLNGLIRSDVSVLFSSSNGNIVSVNQNTGDYTMLGEGSAEIICAFEKNPNIKTMVSVECELALSDNQCSISTNPMIGELQQYDVVTMESYLLINGVKDISVPINFTLSGVPSSLYTVTNMASNAFTLECLESYESEPLVVLCSAYVNGETYTNSLNIKLIGILGR